MPPHHPHHPPHPDPSEHRQTHAPRDLRDHNVPPDHHEPPRHPDPIPHKGHHPDSEIPEEVVAGHIQEWTVNDNDDPDGFVLDTGEHVHIPPRRAADVIDVLPPGTEVTAHGRTHDTPDGTHFHARTLEAAGRSIGIDGPLPGMGPRAFVSRDPVHAVLRAITELANEVRGLRLDVAELRRRPQDPPA